MRVVLMSLMLTDVSTTSAEVIIQRQVDSILSVDDVLSLVIDLVGQLNHDVT